MYKTATRSTGLALKRLFCYRHELTISSLPPLSYRTLPENNVQSLIDHIYTLDSNIKSAQVIYNGMKIAKYTKVSAIMTHGNVQLQIQTHDGLQKKLSPRRAPSASILSEKISFRSHSKQNNSINLLHLTRNTLLCHETRMNLEAVENKNEFDLYRNQESRLSRSVKRSMHLTKATTFMALNAQFFFMAYLVWDVQSWDVMEPVTYFIGLTVVVGTSLYHTITKHVSLYI